jgi:hypothetical protein
MINALTEDSKMMLKVLPETSMRQRYRWWLEAEKLK